MRHRTASRTQERVIGSEGACSIPRFFRDNLEAVRAARQHRGIDLGAELEQLAGLEAERRRLIPELEGLKRDQNSAGEEVARAKRRDSTPPPIFEDNKARGAADQGAGAPSSSRSRQRRNRGLLALPNLPHASVPVGKSAADNVEVRRLGDAARVRLRAAGALGSRPGARHHRFRARAPRSPGARFTVLMGAGARLARALINFMLDLHTREHGYTEVEPPFLVNTRVAAPAPATCRSSRRTCSRSPATGICT